MKKKFIIYMVLSLMILGKVFAQEETPQIRILNSGFMKSPNMYVHLKAPTGWIVDDNFAQWAGYLIGFLPTDAYGNDGVNMTFYMLGFLEEGDPKTYKEFLKCDENNYKQNGIIPEYKNINFKLDDETGMEDYGICEIYGLPNSKVEMMFVAKTTYGNIVLFFAAKGTPDEKKTNEAKNKFIELCKSITVELK